MRPCQTLTWCAVVMTLASGSVATAQGQQADPIEWSLGAVVLTPDDRETIVVLARGGGIDVPARAAEGFIAPIGDRFLTVRSKVTVEGNHVTWRELDVCRADWSGCTIPFETRSGPPTWRIFRGARDRDTWRVRDGTWSVEISLGAGVSYAIAQAVARGIHRRTIIDVRPTLPGRTRSRDPLPMIDPNTMQSIPAAGNADEFTVSAGQSGGGWILGVRVRGSRVELLSAATFVV
jgi:hypothetical protein